MMVFLLKCFGPIAPYLAAAVAALGLGLYITFLRHEVVSATQRSQGLMLINQADAAAIAADQRREAALNAALDAMDQQIAAGDEAVGKINAAISDASPVENAPVAPVLAQTLDRLRALQASAP